MKENAQKTPFGYELIWTETESYCSKILVFDSSNQKIPFQFHKTTTKSWFVNAGKFKIRWIDVKDGKQYETEVGEGSVFHFPPLMPHSVESMIPGGSITEASNTNPSKDSFLLQPVN